MCPLYCSLLQKRYICTINKKLCIRINCNMEKSFIGLLENSIKSYWDLPALSDYKGITLQYKDLARKIEKVHILLAESGVRQGDKISICGRNSAHWGVAFLAALTYGAVAVPILHEFKPENIHHIVNHSDSKLLFVGDGVWEEIDEAQMPALEGIVLLGDFTLLISRSEKLTYAREHLNELFGKKYPNNFRKDHVTYRRDTPEELALINYTSGTTSASKGVMLPYRSVWSNVTFAKEVIDLNPGDKVVSMLPLAHVYGMSFEFLYEICNGSHIHFLTRIPSPKIILQAFSEIKPKIVIAVPLIIEKIIKKNVLPKIDNLPMRILLKTPIINDKIKEKIKNQIAQVFGGEFYQVIVGGAAFNHEVEKFLKDVEFPYTVGYGMTECGPIIAYEDWKRFKEGSCGKAAPRMEICIDSADPLHIVGEILTRGDNVMLGYYKNPEATAEVLKDGWLRTGDLGTLDEEGNLTIKGRSKNMLLGPSGQNIYPEEIEEKINNLPYVNESVVIQLKDYKLAALIHPDYDAANVDHLSTEDLQRIMEENRILANSELPAYSAISKVKIYEQEFEKTPKKSIKRFLYQNTL